MKFIADFHIHSRYSRATSSSINIPTLSHWSKLKGVNLLGSGDFTHHLWLEELKRYLKPAVGRGLYVYDGVHFVLSGEISSIFTQKGKVYKVHNLVLAPSFEVVQEINKALSSLGNLASDGRPILGINCYSLAELLFNISDDIMLIPAHIWTPWFSLFGSNSGFDNIEDAFGKYTSKITALETGLSSDPLMNWRLSALDKFSLVSNSDAHSPSKIAREANVFDCDLDYFEIKNVLQNKDKQKFLYTIEFFPEEGKYHYDGHRNCNISLHPSKTKEYRNLCPVCGRGLTLGVLNRVNHLADRQEGFIPNDSVGFKSLVPLEEIIASVKSISKTSKQVEREYLDILSRFPDELSVLSEIPFADLKKHMSLSIAEGIMKVRDKQLSLIPGFDGEYGKIEIIKSDFASSPKEQSGSGQMTLF